jgi:molybdopterin molybdotransferase
MMPFADAQRAIIAACGTRQRDEVDLRDAVGRVLMHDIIASDDLVPFARSAMDGFAVRSVDVRQAPVSLPRHGAIFAAPGIGTHVPGTATAIATGAAIPLGADCVIPIEDVDVAPDAITIGRPVAAGAHIFPPGDDARRGEVLLARGTLITPAGLGLLAAAGMSRVAVYRQPRVAILCSGDELVDIEATPRPGQVRDSNGVMLAAALTATGARVDQPLRSSDDRVAIRTALARAFAQADLVVTTGGASVGERDFIKAACSELGVSFLFETVALRPAKPTAFGRSGSALVAILPGNPAAAFVAVQEFVTPAVRALGGHNDARLPRVCATLNGTINAKPGRHFAAFAALAAGPTGFIATPLANQCSSLTRTAAEAAALIIVPPGPRTYGPGDRIDADVFEWSRIEIASSVEALALA